MVDVMNAISRQRCRLPKRRGMDECNPLTGWVLSPMIVAMAMSFSSASVIDNASRLRFAQI